MSVSAPARTLARERAMQFLFSIAFTNYDWREVMDEFWESNPSRPNVRKYGEMLITGINEKIGAVEDALIRALKGWRPERVGRVEWAILLVAAYEILFVKDVPPRVAIDEAIELAKRYAPAEGATFINGVLDGVMHTAERRDSTTFD